MNHAQSIQLPGDNTKPVQLKSLPQYAQLYIEMKQHFLKDEWEAGSILLNELLKRFPQVQELQDLRIDVQQHLFRAKSAPYRNDPNYRSAMHHIKRNEWAPALVLVEQLATSFPSSGELAGLQHELQRRVRVRRNARRRTLLLIWLVLLSGMAVAVSALFVRYVAHPEPLAMIIAPKSNLNYPPHYLFSIYGVDKPVGVGVSANGDRIYVTEMGGERLVKIFDQDGNPIKSVEEPHTSIGDRAPVYLATDPTGRVFVTDRKQQAVFIFNRDGDYLNSLIGPGLLISDYVKSQGGAGVAGEKFSYNPFQNVLSYQAGDGSEQTLDIPIMEDWSPLGIRIDQNGQMLITDVTKNRNSILIGSLPQDQSMELKVASEFTAIGKTGQGEGEFLYPNAAVSDSQGRIYVSDGNNARISVWDQAGNFLFSFGRNGGDGAISLPRGILIDQKDRLFVVDAVGQNVKVYDVSGAEPVFLFAFGDFGLEDGLFNYPNDIAMDTTGRIYIVDRENNRVQVWSF
jgi:DNA-binding beta-propeller fold protein YncE